MTDFMVHTGLFIIWLFISGFVVWLSTDYIFNDDKEKLTENMIYKVFICIKEKKVL